MKMRVNEFSTVCRIPEQAISNTKLPVSLDFRQTWVLGTILGDGYIDRKGRLYIFHTIHQKDYLFWKSNKLEAMCSNCFSLPRMRTQKHPKTNKLYRGFYVRSKTGLFLSERDYFYSSGTKVIPADIGSFISEEALAVWFMDDGGRNSSVGRGMVIDVSGYSPKSQEILQMVLHSKFNLETTFHRRSENNTKIYIRASSAARFCELVRPWMCESMMYKLTC